MVDRAEADAKLADLVRLVLLLAGASTHDILPVILGELGIVVDIESRALVEGQPVGSGEDDNLTCALWRLALPGSGAMRLRPA